MGLFMQRFEPESVVDEDDPPMDDILESIRNLLKEDE